MYQQLKANLLVLFCFGIISPGQATPTNCSMYRSAARQEITDVANDVVQKIKQSEFNSGGFRKKSCTCEFKVKIDGPIVGLKIVKTTGSETDNKDFLSLIKLASPFRPHSAKLGDMVYLVDFMDCVSTDGMNFQSDFILKDIGDKQL